jgi:hydroxymethylbilane synthase
MDTLRIAAIDEPISLAAITEIGFRLGVKPGAPRLQRVIAGSTRHREERFQKLSRLLLGGEADVLVWPAWELPRTLPEGLSIVAIVRTGDGRLRLVTTDTGPAPAFHELPARSKVVTCDPATRAQILNRFPHLWAEVEPPGIEILLGLRHAIWDAACIPAELLSLGPANDLKVSTVALEEILPPSGQGAITILAPAGRGAKAEGGRAALVARLAILNDRELETCLVAERVFLRNVGDVAGAVATAHATLSGQVMDITGVLVGQEGEWRTGDGAEADARYGETLAIEIADSCRQTSRRARAGIMSLEELVAG